MGSSKVEHNIVSVDLSTGSDLNWIIIMVARSPEFRRSSRPTVAAVDGRSRVVRHVRLACVICLCDRVVKHSRQRDSTLPRSLPGVCYRHRLASTCVQGSGQYCRYSAPIISPLMSSYFKISQTCLTIFSFYRFIIAHLSAHSYCKFGASAYPESVAELTPTETKAAPAALAQSLRSKSY